MSQVQPRLRVEYMGSGSVDLQFHRLALTGVGGGVQAGHDVLGLAATSVTTMCTRASQCTIRPGFSVVRSIPALSMTPTR